MPANQYKQRSSKTDDSKLKKSKSFLQNKDKLIGYNQRSQVLKLSHKQFINKNHNHE